MALHLLVLFDLRDIFKWPLKRVLAGDSYVELLFDNWRELSPNGVAFLHLENGTQFQMAQLTFRSYAIVAVKISFKFLSVLWECSTETQAMGTSADRAATPDEAADVEN